MMTTFAVATPHALVLSVSHGLLFCQPLSVAAAQMPPVAFTKNFQCCMSLLPAACPDRPDRVRGLDHQFVTGAHRSKRAQTLRCDCHECGHETSANSPHQR
jgi:hypothetical protein